MAEATEGLAAVVEQQQNMVIAAATEQRDALVSQVEALVVSNQAEYQKAAEFLKHLAELRNGILIHTRPVVSAAHLAHKAAKNQENELVNPIKAAEAKLGRTMGAYVQRQKALQEDAEREARRKREAIEDAALEKAQAMQDDGKTEEAAAVMETVPRVPVTVEQVDAPKVAGTQRTTTWKFEVEDPYLLPKEYLIPDVQTIGRVVRSSKGAIAIPGVRVWCDVNVGA